MTKYTAEQLLNLPHRDSQDYHNKLTDILAIFIPAYLNDEYWGIFTNNLNLLFVIETLLTPEQQQKYITITAGLTGVTYGLSSSNENDVLKAIFTLMTSPPHIRAIALILVLQEDGE